MKFHVVYLNKNNQVDLTKDDLEKLLTEAYHEGFEAGRESRGSYWGTNVIPCNLNNSDSHSITLNADSVSASPTISTVTASNSKMEEVTLK